MKAKKASSSLAKKAAKGLKAIPAAQKKLPPFLRMGVKKK